MIWYSSENYKIRYNDKQQVLRKKKKNHNQQIQLKLNPCDPVLWSAIIVMVMVMDKIYKGF